MKRGRNRLFRQVALVLGAFSIYSLIYRLFEGLLERRTGILLINYLNVGYISP
jgi:hypothetical protein